LFTIIVIVQFQWRNNGVGRVGLRVQEPPSSGQNFKKIPVAVKIRTSGHQTLECFTTTLPT